MWLRAFQAEEGELETRRSAMAPLNIRTYFFIVSSRRLVSTEPREELKPPERLGLRQCDTDILAHGVRSGLTLRIYFALRSRSRGSTSAPLAAALVSPNSLVFSTVTV